MEVYKELLGHPPIQASGTGPGAVKAQAPTGLFLFTHQQWLIHGAMQLIDTICTDVPLPYYMRITIESLIQLQLEEADSETTVSQIRSRWHWTRSHKAISITYYLAYVLAARPTSGPTPLCTIMTGGDHGSFIGYESNGDQGYNQNQVLSNPSYSLSAPDIVHENSSALTSEIMRYQIQELAITPRSSGLNFLSDQDYPSMNQQLGTDLQVTMKDQREKAATVCSVRNCVHQATICTGYDGDAYIIYQRLPTPAPTPPLVPPAETPA
ncbi:MAG: hypothetical protein LBJ69_00815 [Holosporales bacterium]|jgi:hypothetical protein|nr:hypothetical protein [Holosporales bacterium]